MSTIPKPIALVPGLTCSVDFARNLAFVGLSQVRESVVTDSSYFCGSGKRKCAKRNVRESLSAIDQQQKL
jgi:hypothetical protein